ncbi:subtilisin-like protein [Clavulina sp. PMI_390]|nr:subtilisin-like protein [Clavulina sp. PMI_390]
MSTRSTASTAASSLADIPPEKLKCTTELEDSYVVLFKDNVSPADKKQHITEIANKSAVYKTPKSGGKTYAGVERVFHGGHGYMGIFHKDVVDAIQTDIKVVKKIQKNEESESFLDYTPLTTKNWGLSMISLSPDKFQAQFNPQSRLQTFTDVGYNCIANQGEGVNIFVLDNGFKDDDFKKVANRAALDLGNNGDWSSHGTVVSSYAAGDSFGAAPKANLIFFNDDRTLNGKLYALDEITWRISEGHTGYNKPAVINCSWGMKSTDAGDIVNAELNKLIQVYDVVVVAAAGNYGGILGLTHGGPAGTNNRVIAVGAVDIDGKVWENSEHGSHVDIYAPGVNMPVKMANGSYTKVDGTSIAAPIVTGVVACILSDHEAKIRNLTEANRLHPSEVRDRLQQWARVSQYNDPEGLEKVKILCNYDSAH